MQSNCRTMNLSQYKWNTDGSRNTPRWPDGSAKFLRNTHCTPETNRQRKPWIGGDERTKTVLSVRKVMTAVFMEYKKNRDWLF